MPTCIQCGATVEPGVATCQACGLPMPAIPFGGTSESPVVSAAGVPAAPGVTPAPVARQSLAATIALVVLAVVTIALVAFVLLWNVLGLAPDPGRTDDVVLPPNPPKVEIPKVEISKTETPKTEPVDSAAPGSGVPITTPSKGTGLRKQLMDTGHEVLEIREPFQVEHLFVQGPRAVGIVTPVGSRTRYLLVWELMEGTGGAWDVIYNGEVGAGSREALQSPDLDLSAEIVDKLGL